MTFLRDPVERALSHFHHWRRHPNPADPLYRELASSPEGYTLEAFVRHPMLHNLYSRNLANDVIDDEMFIGIAEQFDRSIALLERVLGVWVIGGAGRRNVNEGRGGTPYEVDAETRAVIETSNAGDIQLYRIAVESFEREASRVLAKRRWVWPWRWR